MEIGQKRKHYSRCQSARSVVSKRSRASSVLQINQKYESIKESQRTWLLNRRKQKLKQASQQNIAMYFRILQQKSMIKGFNQEKIKFKKKTYIRKRLIPNKQNFDLTVNDKQLSKRSNQIIFQLNKSKISNMLRI